METSSLALTDPNVLVTLRISSTAGASRVALPPPVRPSANRLSLPLRCVGDLDVAADDAPSGLVHLVFDPLRYVALEASERGEAEAILLQAEVDHLSAGEVAVVGVLDGLVDRVVDALDHRGEDRRVRDELGLVGVHADGEDLLVLGGIEEAGARSPGGV